MRAIEVTAENGVATICLNRPAVLNAINEPMVDQFVEALDGIERDASICAFVITGSGRAFCVGSDLKEGHGDARARIAQMHALIVRLTEFPKASVAAINGLALGGGLELAMACTFRVAANTARMGLPEILHSLMPSYGGTQLLPRLIGYGRAMELALTGEMIDAVEAERLGLVSAVADDALGAAMDLVDRCSRGGQLAQLEIRRAIAGGWGLPLVEGLEIEAAAALRISDSDEAKRAVARFGAGHR